MKLVYKSPSALPLGYYLLYARSKTGKYLYVLQVTEEAMVIFKMLVLEDPKGTVSVFKTPRTLPRNSLSRGRDAPIYELTDDEFMLEVSDLI